MRVYDVCSLTPLPLFLFLSHICTRLANHPTNLPALETSDAPVVHRQIKPNQHYNTGRMCRMGSGQSMVDGRFFLTRRHRFYHSYYYHHHYHRHGYRK